MPTSSLLGDGNTLIASLIWGSVGMGYFIFGKKQQRMVLMLSGIAQMAVTYFVGSALYMSLIVIAIIAATHWLKDRWD